MRGLESEPVAWKVRQRLLRLQLGVARRDAIAAIETIVRSLDEVRDALTKRPFRRKLARAGAWGLGGVALVVAAVTAVRALQRSPLGPFRVAARTATDASELPDASIPAEPGDVVAEFTFSDVDGAWARVRSLLSRSGGTVATLGLLPTSFGAALRLAFNVDSVTTSFIEGAQPAFAVLRQRGGEQGVVLAVPVRDVDGLRHHVEHDKSAQYTTVRRGPLTLAHPSSGFARRMDDARNMNVDAGATGSRGINEPALKQPAFAVLANGYLLVATHADDIEKLAPYLTVALPMRRRQPVNVDQAGTSPAVQPSPPPADASSTPASVEVRVPHDALANVVGPSLSHAWQRVKTFLIAADEQARRDHDGRPPDFGEPAAIVEALDAWVARQIDALRDVADVRLRLAFEAGDVQVTARLTPRVGDESKTRWHDSSDAPDATLLESMPAESDVAFFVALADVDHGYVDNAFEQWLRDAFKARLPSATSERMHDVLSALTRSRATQFAVAQLHDASRTTVLRARSGDVSAASQALEGALRLLAMSPFRSMLDVSNLTIAPVSSASWGIQTNAPTSAKTATVRFDAVRAASPSGRSSASRLVRARRVLWGAENDSTLMAVTCGMTPASQGPASPLCASPETIASLAPASSLASRADFLRAVGPLRAHLRAALVFRDPRRAEREQGLVAAALGREGSSGVIRITIPEAAAGDVIAAISSL